MWVVFIDTHGNHRQIRNVRYLLERAIRKNERDSIHPIVPNTHFPSPLEAFSSAMVRGNVIRYTKATTMISQDYKIKLKKCINSATKYNNKQLTN